MENINQEKVDKFVDNLNEMIHDIGLETQTMQVQSLKATLIQSRNLIDQFIEVA